MTTARPEPEWEEPRALRLLGSFVSGPSFPLVALGALGAFALATVAALVLRPSQESLGAFADDFRQWCFGWDPATHRVQWASVVVTLLSPLVLMALVAAWWRAPLLAARTASRTRRGATIGAGAALTLAACSGLLLLSPAPEGALPFPAEALRLHARAPDFTLVDQHGERVSLRDQRGRVVLLTGVYSRCSTTCPMLLAESRRALDALTLEERRDVVLVAITLDPGRDDAATLLRLAEAHGLRAPGSRLLTGARADVDAALDALGIERRRDAATGLIDHPGTYLVIDREGRVAYRLALGARRRAWLPAALRACLREPQA